MNDELFTSDRQAVGRVNPGIVTHGIRLQVKVGFEYSALTLKCKGLRCPGGCPVNQQPQDAASKAAAQGSELFTRRVGTLVEQFQIPSEATMVLELPDAQLACRSGVALNLLLFVHSGSRVADAN